LIFFEELLTIKEDVAFLCINVIGQVAWNKSSLLLKIILQNSQTLQLFTINIKHKLFTKAITMPSLRAWLNRPSGLIQRGKKSKHF